VGSTAKFGALSISVAALAAVVWFALELAQPNLGFEDTDNAAVGVAFLREHSEIHVQAGIVLMVIAVTLMVASFAVSDVLAPRSNSLALRSTTAFGVLAAASFFMLGVLRLAVGPVLYINSLDRDWGEAAYLVILLLGTHGFAQAAITALCLWAVGLSLIGLRTRALPLALCALGILPALRIVGALVGQLDVLPEEAWFVFIASIVGVMLWCLGLGVVLWRMPSGASSQSRVEPLPVAT
jgi:hypothetical protein